MLNRFLFLATLPLLTAGCGITIQNQTSQAMTRNPSGLYVVSVEVNRLDNTVIAGTIQPHIVLPETAQTAPMVATPFTSNRWEYTIHVPATATQWPYYFKVDYMAEKALVKQEPRSQLDPADAPQHVYRLYITDRTAANLDARRGRVGSTIKLLGRGFTVGDQVLLDGQAVATRFESENTLSFQVPPVAPNRKYKVELSGGGSTLNFGELLVDVSNFVTSPDETPIAFEATVYMDFNIPEPAPAGGLPVRVEVSDPSVLELPATVTVPQGSTRGQMIAKARHVGFGAITLSAEGFNNGTIPFRVLVPKSR
jgi:hypothetical protein